MDERGTQKIFMDEYEISSALKRSLKIGKKLEEFELIINDPSRYTYGQDYKKVLKVIGDKPLASVFPLKYRVKVYFFSSGENCYTMGVTEKIKYCEMKKPKIATLLKEGVYDKAKKMLMKVQEMTEKVDKHNRSPESITEELDKLFPYRKSALLNLTLCLWKLKEWKELVVLARKIIDTGVDPTNPKLLYRLLLGLYESKHYDEVLSSFNKYSEQIFSGLDRADIDKQYPEIIEIYKKSEIMEKNIQAKEKNMYSGILGALGEK
jgi:tetratricopeptide (TPR) repeat protein